MRKHRILEKKTEMVAVVFADVFFVNGSEKLFHRPSHTFNKQYFFYFSSSLALFSVLLFVSFRVQLFTLFVNFILITPNNVMLISGPPGLHSWFKQ